MIIHISKSVGPPIPWPSFLPIKSMRDQQHKRWKGLINMINSSKKTFNFFPLLLLWFPTSCFGSSSHDHNTLHSRWKFVHIKILLAHNFDWYSTRQQLCSVCFWQFFLLEIGLTVMSFKWSPECKNMLHGFSPRSPVPSGVSTHLKLSFRWGDNCIFLLTAQNQAWFFNGRINIHI